MGLGSGGKWCDAMQCDAMRCCESACVKVRNNNNSPASAGDAKSMPRPTIQLIRLLPVQACSASVTRTCGGVGEMELNHSIENVGK